MTRFNETAVEKKARLKENFEITLTAEQIFVLQCALEQFVDIRDSEFRKTGEIGRKINFPKIDVVWDDVAS